MELLHVGGSTNCAAEFITAEGAVGSARTSHHLGVTGQPILASQCLLFITKIQTLRVQFFVFLNRTMFTLAVIRVLLFPLTLKK